MDKAKINIETLSVSRIIVKVAHPDYIKSWCAGTLCHFVDAGKHVCYVLCTSGDKGACDPTCLSTSECAIMSKGIVPEIEGRKL